MKKIMSMVAVCVVGLSVAAVRAEVPVADPAAAPAAVAQDLTVKGTVSVVNDASGALQAIYVNPADGQHGYKLDIVNGEGKTLADKNGKVVEITGTDESKLFVVKTVTVVE